VKARRADDLDEREDQEADVPAGCTAEIVGVVMWA